MDEDGDLLRQTLLQGTLVGSGSLLSLEACDLLLRQRREDLDIACRIGIIDIQPELVEGVWARALGIEPYIATLGLTELTTVGLRDQRTYQSIGLASIHTADQLRTRGDIPPLVRAPHLQTAAVVAIEIQIIVALQELVAEFGEGHPVGVLAAEALLHRVLSHHIVDRDMLADVADEAEEAVVLHPVVVIHQHGSVGGIAIEVEELRQLLLDASLVVAERLFVEEVTLGGLHRGVTNHPRSTADEGDRAMACQLEVAQHHDPDEVADVKGVCRGVNTQICRGTLLL